MRQLLGGRNFIKKKVGLHQSRAFRRVVLGAMPIFCLAFLTAFLAASIFAPINTSNATETTVNATVAYGGYSLSLSTETGVTLALNAGSNGSMTVQPSNVTISTTALSGYKLYLGMTGTNASTNSLVSGANELTSSGTIAAPRALTNGTWGYAIPSGSISVTNGFATSYSSMSSEVPIQSGFAAVPAGESNYTLIDETDEPNTTPKVIPVYYGVRAGFETPTGSYTNKVLYTAIADAGATTDLFIYPSAASATNVSSTSPLILSMPLMTTLDVEANAYLLTETQYNNGNPDLANLDSAKLTCTKNTQVNILQLSCPTPEKEAGNYHIYVDVPYYNMHYEKAFSYIDTILTITPASIDAETAATITVTFPVSTDYAADITMQSTALTCTKTSGSPLTYSCAVPATTAGTYAISATVQGDIKTYTGSLTVENPALYMQDQTNIDACKNAATGTTFTLTDSRDDSEYKVRKLADGKCWMVENLRLQNKTITSADSNVSANFTVPAPSAADSTDWCKESSAACDDKPLTFDATDTSVDGQGSADPTWGIYYNWYTATAGNGTYSTSSGTVSYDICPKGWRLPTGGDSGELKTLYTSYGSSATNLLSETGPAFVLSGHRYGGSTSDQGSYGDYWSSTVYNSGYAYDLYLYSSNVYPASGNRKYSGFSVRCVAK